MKLEKIHLQNFQSYENADVDFGEGVTLITGPNGSGKSTLLRAVFAGLFQSDATSETSADYALADLVRKSETDGAVELTFSVDGVEYTICWEITVTEDDDGERKGKTKSCSLTSSAFSETIEGVRDVREAVVDIVGMDASSFANSVFVQQKRLSRLIDATPSERKSILDGLLGLDRIDEYIKRMKLARRAAKNERDSIQGSRQEVQSRIDEIDDERLKQEQETLSKKISSLEGDLEKARNLLNKNKDRLADVKEKINRYNELKETKEDYNSRIEEQKSRISDLNKKISALRETIHDNNEAQTEAEERISELSEQIEAYNVTTKQEAKDAKSTLEEERVKLAQTAQKHQSRVDELTRRISELESEKDALSREVTQNETEKATLETEITELQETIETLHDDVEEATESRNNAVASFLEISEEAVTQESKDRVKEKMEASNTTRENLGNELSKLRGQKEAAETQVERIQKEIRDAEEERQDVLSRVSLEVDNLDDAIEKAIVQASEAAHQFDITVTEDRLNEILSSDVPAVREEVFNSIKQTSVKVSETTVHVDELESVFDEARSLDSLTQNVVTALQLKTLIEVSGDVRQQEQEVMDITETITELETKISQLEVERDEQAHIISTGQEVLVHFDAVKTARERVSTVKDELEHKTEERAEYDDEIERIQQRITELGDSTLDKETSLAEEEERLAGVEDEKAELQETIDRVEEVVSLYDHIESLQTENKTASEQIEGHMDSIETFRKDIRDFKIQVDEIDSKLGGMDVESLQETKKEIGNVVSQAESAEERVSKQLTEKRKELVETEGKLKNYEHEKKRARELDEQVEWASTVVSEMNETIETYDAVKIELRENTLGVLNKYTNEVFTDLYQHESYIGVRIDEDYNILLVDSGGETIDPNKCSGGEGVITNIALRAGVYRVIVEQDNENGAGLPPFILDEPTNHLDATHVGKIEGVIEAIQKWDVPQVFVVSHRESLMHGCDYELQISKNPATDASEITRIVNTDPDPAPEVKN